jgi:hypothetical protein
MPPTDGAAARPDRPERLGLLQLLLLLQFVLLQPTQAPACHRDYISITTTTTTTTVGP